MADENKFCDAIERSRAAVAAAEAELGSAGVLSIEAYTNLVEATGLLMALIMPRCNVVDDGYLN